VNRGRKLPATADANSALALAWNREVEYEAAVALAMAGDEQNAKLLLPNRKGIPLRQLSPIQLLAGDPRIVGINASDPLKSVELLESATSYELGSPRSALVWYFGSLYPIFVPGDADLVARRADDAAREYEKILSHRDLMIGGSPIGLGALLPRSRL